MRRESDCWRNVWIGSLIGFVGMALACGGSSKPTQVIVSPATVSTPSENTTEDPNIANPTSTTTADPWQLASSIVQTKDIKVETKNVAIKKIPLKTLLDEGSNSQEELLMVVLRIENLSPTKKIAYRSWQGRQLELVPTNVATLSDEHDNNYKRIRFEVGTKIEGNLESESIYPGKPVTDVLVFEVPVDVSKELRLTLPAGAYGGDENGNVNPIHDLITS